METQAGVAAVKCGLERHTHTDTHEPKAAEGVTGQYGALLLSLPPYNELTLPPAASLRRVSLRQIQEGKIQEFPCCSSSLTARRQGLVMTLR